MIDSLSSNSGAFSVTAVNLPVANVDLGGGLLGDTITITAPSGISFTTSGATPSRALVGNQGQAGDEDWGSDTAWVLSMSASSMKVMARRGGSSFLKVTNLGLATPPPGALLFDLQTPDSMAIDSVNSAYPVSSDQATATAIAIPANDTAIVYGTAPPGALNGGFSQAYYTFTTTATHVIQGTLAWFGSGSPYSTTAPNTTDYTEDLDFLVCNASTACDESAADLTGFAGASTHQPEVWTTASLPAAQYWIGVLGFNVSYAIEFRMTLILQ